MSSRRSRPVRLQRTAGLQRGAVLILALVFLLLLAMIASTVVRSSALQLRMAGNDQFRETAQQKALAIASALSGQPENFRISGGVGYTLCRPGDSCDSATLAVAAVTEAVPAGVELVYQVRRQGPLLVEALPLRLSESNVSSNQVFNAAIFEVSVRVDGSAVRLGSAEVARGIAVPVPASGQ